VQGLIGRDSQVSNARRCAAIRSRHATGIEKAHAADNFVSRHMGVTMEQDVAVVRRTIGRDVLQSKAQTIAPEIDHNRPIRIAITISPNEY